MSKRWDFDHALINECSLSLILPFHRNETYTWLSFPTWRHVFHVLSSPDWTYYGGGSTKWIKPEVSLKELESVNIQTIMKVFGILQRYEKNIGVCGACRQIHFRRMIPRCSCTDIDIDAAWKICSPEIVDETSTPTPRYVSQINKDNCCRRSVMCI